MAASTKGFRLRLYSQAASPSVDLVFYVGVTGQTSSITTIPAIPSPEPSPYEGRTRSQNVTFRVASEAITAALATAEGRIDWTARLVDWSETTNDGGSYDVLWTGRVTTGPSELEGPGAYSITCQDENWLSRRQSLFPTAGGTTMLHPSGLTTAWGPFPAREAPEWEVIATDGTDRLMMAGRGFDIEVPDPVAEFFLADLEADAVANRSDGDGNFRFTRFRDTAGATDREVLSMSNEDRAFRWTATLKDASPSVGSVWVYWPAHGKSAGNVVNGYLYAPDAPPSEANPRHIGGATGMDLGEFLEDCLDGTLNETALRVDTTTAFAAYDESTNPDGLKSHPFLPRVLTIIDEPAVLSDWLRDHILAPLRLPLFTDANGRISPRLWWALQDTNPTTLPVLSAANGSVLRFDPRGNQTINALRFTVPTITTETADRRPPERRDRTPDRLRVSIDTPEALDRVHDNVAAIGRRERTYDLTAFAPAGGRVINRITYEALVNAIRRDVFERAGDGPVWYEGETHDSTVMPGDYVVLDADSLKFPNASINARSGDRIAQVATREIADGGAYYRLTLEDIGPAGQPLTAPTVTVAQNASNPGTAVDVTLSNLPAGAGYILEIDRGQGSGFEPAGDGDGNETVTIDTGILPDTLIKARAASTEKDRVRSAWSTVASVTTAATPYLLSAVLEIDDGVATVKWAAHTTAAGLDVSYGTSATEEDPTSWTDLELDASLGEHELGSFSPDLRLVVQLTPRATFAGGSTGGASGDVTELERWMSGVAPDLPDVDNMRWDVYADGSAILTWTNLGSAGLDIQWSYQESGELPTIGRDQADANDLEFSWDPGTFPIGAGLGALIAGYSEYDDGASVPFKISGTKGRVRGVVAHDPTIPDPVDGGDPVNKQWALATFDTGGGGGVTDHGDLTGLSDTADHPWALDLAQHTGVLTSDKGGTGFDVGNKSAAQGALVWLDTTGDTIQTSAAAPTNGQTPIWSGSDWTYSTVSPTPSPSAVGHMLMANAGATGWESKSFETQLAFGSRLAFDLSDIAWAGTPGAGQVLMTTGASAPFNLTANTPANHGLVTTGVLNAHTSDTGNPHSVTAAQVGAYPDTATLNDILGVLSASKGGTGFNVAGLPAQQGALMWVDTTNDVIARTAAPGGPSVTPVWNGSAWTFSTFSSVPSPTGTGQMLVANAGGSAWIPDDIDTVLNFSGRSVFDLRDVVGGVAKQAGLILAMVADAGEPTGFSMEANTIVNHGLQWPWSQISGEPVFTTRWPTWTEVTSKPSTFPPEDHAGTHESGGSDVLNVADLAGIPLSASAGGTGVNVSALPAQQGALLWVDTTGDLIARSLTPATGQSPVWNGSQWTFNTFGTVPASTSADEMLVSAPGGAWAIEDIATVIAFSSRSVFDLGNVYFAGAAAAGQMLFTRSGAGVHPWDVEARDLVSGDIPGLGAGKITSGTFANARISQASVTQHEGALSINWTQVAGRPAIPLSASDGGTGFNVGSLSPQQGALLWVDTAGDTIQRSLTPATGQSPVWNGSNWTFNTLGTVPSSTGAGEMLVSAPGGAWAVEDFETELSFSNRSIFGLGDVSIPSPAVDQVLVLTDASAPYMVTAQALTASQIPSLPASRITSGTFANSRISQSSVTQHLSGYAELSGDTFTGAVEMPELVMTGANILRDVTSSGIIIAPGPFTSSGANYILHGSSHGSLADVHRWRASTTDLMRLSTGGLELWVSTILRDVTDGNLLIGAGPSTSSGANYILWGADDTPANEHWWRLGGATKAKLSSAGLEVVDSLGVSGASPNGTYPLDVQGNVRATRFFTT